MGIKKFITNLFGAGKRGKHNQPGKWRVYSKDEHGIRVDDISRAALRTCQELQMAGYKAFVVGGAVRDLLLNRHPKDFDVATDATPEQVRAVFRRSRIIGRRFRLVHVMFGAETVEVSTFRAGHDAAPADDNDEDSAEYSSGNDNDRARADEHGRLLRDNVFGSQEEDAIRRDFTMNALFYDPAREEVWDCVHGVADIKQKRVVMIGDPVTRYREDPVRMLRAARLAGKLGFSIDPATERPIADLAALLDNVPGARLFDEMLKLLLSGHALVCIEKLHALGLHQRLLPTLDQLLSASTSRPLVTLALTRTDLRIAEDKGVSPAFLLAALFWPLVSARYQELEAGGMRPIPALHDAMDDVLETQRRTLAIPRRLDGLIKELWLLQPRFLQRSKVKAYRLLNLPKFRAAYDFYALRAEAGDASTEIADWWEKFQFADDATREVMLQPDEAPKKKRKRRKKPAAERVTGDGPSAPAPAPVPVPTTGPTPEVY